MEDVVGDPVNCVESGFHNDSNRGEPQHQGEDSPKQKALLLHLPTGDVIEPFPKSMLNLLGNEIGQEAEADCAGLQRPLWNIPS